ncbi:hypothetical protein GXW74_24895 [Roseomonas eburnea]|uniref:Uncharacterized protein n=1 Tax=Neoroseomonas eburnea TaxID=1346889 RepID=A0A9X9XJ52_9PROT|nr:hypothetical protein [Neoroseomonas eburnea]MBR0683738.1 hypothetical protein [Neoroseomonas eburnea]
MTRRPGWVVAWAVAGVLAVIWLVAFAVAPAECNMIGRCPWWSGFGVIVLGAPVVALSVLAALAMSLVAWIRHR